jgi:hypothetical protein
MDEIDGFLPEAQVYHQSDLLVFVLELLNECNGEMRTVVEDTELCKERRRDLVHKRGIDLLLYHRPVVLRHLCFHFNHQLQPLGWI